MSNPCETHRNVKADGYCPICLARRAEEMHRRAQQAEGTVERIKMVRDWVSEQAHAGTGGTSAVWQFVERELNRELGEYKNT